MTDFRATLRVKHPNAPISFDQRETIFALLREREVAQADADRLRQRLADHTIRKGLAGQTIEWLKRRPVRQP